MIISVVKSLDLYAPIYEEKGWRGLGTTPAYLTSPVIVEVPDPSEIEESKNVYFRFSKTDSTIYINETKYPLNEWVNSPWGTIRFSKNPLIGNPANRQFYFSLIDVKKVASGLQNLIEISASGKLSTIINRN